MGIEYTNGTVPSVFRMSTLYKNIFVLYAFCLLFLFTGCKGTRQKPLMQIAAETEEDYKLNIEQKIIVNKGNDFSVELFKKIAETEKDTNVFISTIGMFYSLNIINNSASSSARQEISKALGIDSTDPECINNLCRRFIIGQAKHTDNDFMSSASYMRTATLFHVGSLVDIDKHFKKVLEHDYFAGVVKGDIDGDRQQRINKWCAQQTEGLINDFPVNQLDDMSATLMVANYFKAKWSGEFDKKATKNEPFYHGTNATVDMMNNTDSYHYAKLDSFSLLRISFEGEYQLYVFLPDKVDGLTMLLHSLDGVKVRSAISQLKPYTRVYVKMPKFEIGYSFEASQYLTALGIRKIFDNGFELNRIQSEPMKIEEILQKTKLILDEEGMEAAAITSTELAALSETRKKKEITEAYFYADHPFAYIIADPYGNYCFMGTFWGN